MAIGLDPYLKTLIKTQVTIDSAARVFCKGEPLEVHVSGGVRKVLLPNTKFLIPVEDLVAYGAKVLGAQTPMSFALSGANARWAKNQESRTKQGIPHNVYVANARTRNLAIARGLAPPPIKYIGRRQNKMTEVYDTIEEVVTAMNEGNWKTQFRRGRFKSAGVLK